MIYDNKNNNTTNDDYNDNNGDESDDKYNNQKVILSSTINQNDIDKNIYIVLNEVIYKPHLLYEKIVFL